MTAEQHHEGPDTFGMMQSKVDVNCGIATEKQLMNGVAAQSGRVVAVGVATGN